MKGLRLGLSLTGSAAAASQTSSAVWTSTTGNKKASQVTISGGNLTASINGLGAFATVAATSPTAQTNFQFEVTVGSGDTNQNLIGLYNESVVTDVHALAPGWSDNNGIGLNYNIGSTALGFYMNSTSNTQTTTLGSVVATGDVFTIEVDISGAAASHVIRAYRNGTQVLQWTGRTLTGFTTAYVTSKGSVASTANFGGSAFSHTLTGGYAIYG